MYKPENYHENIVKEYYESHLSIIGFCRLKGISYSSFYHSMKRVKQKEKKESPCSFVKVNTTDMVTQLGKNNLDIKIDSSTLIDLLRKLL